MTDTVKNCLEDFSWLYMNESTCSSSATLSRSEVFILTERTVKTSDLLDCFEPVQAVHNLFSLVSFDDDGGDDPIGDRYST